MKRKLQLLSLLMVAGLLFTGNSTFAQQKLDIATITTVDANGELDSIDVVCKIVGVLHGTNMGNGRLDFTVIDGTGGIKVFDYNADDYYTPVEGDELEITGKVSFYNGLAQFGSLDTVIVKSKGNKLQNHKVVTMLDETTENEMVKLEAVWFVDDAPATWKSGNVDVTNGTDTFTVRVDSDTDVDGEAAPQGRFDIAGIGGQFDRNAPYDEGYQLFPQSIMDVDSTPYMPRPSYDIGTVSALDADGRPDSIGVKCRVTGIVYGINFRPGGLTFTLRDATGGMGVFESSKDLGYTVTEGDSITVQGEVAFYNGLTQMSRLDSVIVLSQGHMLADPIVVTKLGENAESNLVKLEKVWMVDADDTTWKSGNHDVTNGTDTFTVRIDSDVNFSDSAIGFDTMNITGLGGQFDRSAPYDEGYQLFPRYKMDIEEWKEPVSVKEIVLNAIVYPNPSNGVITVKAEEVLNAYMISDMQGKVVSASQLGYKTSTLNLDLQEFKSGVYFIHLFSENATSRQQVILK